MQLLARLLGVMMAVAVATSAAHAKPPSWDVRSQKPARFKILKAFGEAAVLDIETGLVWERTPSSTGFLWQSANDHCLGNEIAGRYGWRVPTDFELMSLAQDLGASGIRLPAAHPFIGIAPTEYWTASFAPGRTDVYNLVKFQLVGQPLSFGPPSSAGRVWCVRGGLGP